MEGQTRMTDYLWPGRVTEVIDPHYFWMQLGTADILACFMKLQSDIQHFCSQHWSSVTESDMDGVTGQLVLVDTGQQDVRYKRGQVTRITGDDRVDIFFVDYGCTELTMSDKICIQFPVQFKRWPPQAVRCCLAGIQPIGKTWTTRGVKAFSQLTVGTTLSTLVLFGGVGSYVVSLYSRDGGNARSISHQLLDEEVALPMEGHEVPEHVKDVPKFMASMAKNSDYEGTNGEESTDPVSNGNDNQIPDHTDSSSSQKYIPPGKKLATSSSNTSSGSSPGSTSTKLTLNTSVAQSYSTSKASGNTHLLSNSLKSSEPCPDFFPFENVSTYPPTPMTGGVSSPTKSMARTESMGFGQRSRAKSVPESHTERISQLSKSPVKCDFMPDFGDAVIRLNVSNNSYKEPSPNSVDPSWRHERSPVRTPDHVTSHSSHGNGRPVFYRHGNGNHSQDVQNHQSSLIPPTYFQQSASAKQRFEVDQLNPPEYYKGQAVTDHMSPARSPTKYGTPPRYENSPKPDNYTSYDRSPSNDGSPRYDSPSRYNQSNRYENSGRNNDPTFKNTSKFSSSPNYSGGYFPPEPVIENQSPRTGNQSYQSVSGSPGGYPHREHFAGINDHLKDYKTNSSPLKLKMAQHTPEKSVYTTKASPLSPDSPAYIASFDINDIDHTRHVSTHGLHQKLHQEKLSALQEEAEELKIESREQSSLAEMARYGAGGSFNSPDYDATPTIFDQITEEIKNTSHDIPPNTTRHRDHPRKLDEIPSSFYSDIDFVCAMKDALELAESSDIENTRQLLKEITESLKAACVEKQMYDILLLLIAKGVTDYNQFHPVILDSIDHMNNELNIKESLAKALKRQQELCIRIPLPKNGKHLEFSRLMGHIYNLSLVWTDSNTIHDGILGTLEKWIVFNNKGSQIGQDEKENLFLDCFVAFWEVSGDHVIRHNNNFRSRVQQEIKKKLLNEAVARSIRERLLDILLEFVARAADHDTTEMYTQTPRRTMIPSSCQVKPSVADKGTMARGDIDEQLDNYDISNPGTRWYVNATESPGSSISLRPRAAPVNRGLQSTPQDDHSKPSYNRSADLYAGEPTTSLFAGDLSHNDDTSFGGDASVYVTPNESFAEMKSPSNNKVLENIELSTSDLNKSQNAISPVSSNRNSYSRKESGKSWASMVVSGKHDKQNNDKTVEPISSSLSAKGKSVVDWFDYDPEPRSASPGLLAKSKDKATKKTDKPDSKRKKKADMSMQLIASEFVSKSLPKETTVDNADSVKHQISDEAPHNVPDMNTSGARGTNDKVNVESVGTEGIDHEAEQDVDWWEPADDLSCKPCQDQAPVYDNGPELLEGDQAEENDEAVSECSDIGDVVSPEIAEQIAADAKYAAELDALQYVVSDELAVGEQLALGQELVLGDKLELENKLALDDQLALSGELALGEGAGLDELAIEDELTIGDTLTIGDKLIPAGIERSKDLDAAAELVRDGIRRIDDEYAFDVDGEYDGQWETDSETEDFNLPSVQSSSTGQDVAYDLNFPTSDLKENIRTVESPIETGASGTDTSYNQEFPDTNLADYIRNPESPAFQDPTPTVPPRTWVPGVRRCTVCGDTEHTVYECPNGIQGLLY